MNAVENANINIETVKAMKQASDTMHNIHKKMGIDDVETTMFVFPVPPFPPSPSIIWFREC